MDRILHRLRAHLARLHDLYIQDDEDNNAIENSKTAENLRTMAFRPTRTQITSYYILK